VAATLIKKGRIMSELTEVQADLLKMLRAFQEKHDLQSSVLVREALIVSAHVLKMFER
jgi:hypothetical protein